jgi:RNA polymerase sigma factor (sigma-70 family)
MTSDSEDPTPMLLDAWYSGDQAARDQLLALHLEWIRGAARHQLGNALRRMHDSADVVQAVLVQFLDHGPAFIPESAAQFRSLMARIVRNTLIDLARTETVRGGLHPLHIDRSTVSRLGKTARSVDRPDRHAELAEERNLVQLALRLLEPSDRDHIVLHDWSGRTFSEIGDEHGDPKSTAEQREGWARKRYHRAKLHLAKEVQRLRKGSRDGATSADGARLDDLEGRCR